MSETATQFHPAANIFPMLPDGELQELAEDIRKNGQREPISIYQGMILDGRNRSAACKIADVEAVTITVDPEDPVAFVMSLNLHRRHLTPSQASMCAARAKPLYEAQAKERQKDGGKVGADLTNHKRVQANLPEPVTASQARDAAGKAFGVGGRSVDYASKIIEKGVPELAKAVDEGRMAVSTAAVVASESPEEQKAAIERQANRNYAKLSTRQKPKDAPNKSLHKGDHKNSEVFALAKADVAITQLKGIPVGNDYRNAALERVINWIDSNRKAN